ncbi:MAG: hypothetical protein WC859_07320 [Elusimicrobiota bacterium]
MDMKQFSIKSLLSIFKKSSLFKTIQPRSTNKELVWSPRPGCYEGHLKRRYHNELFPPQYRDVTQKEIDTARLKDNEELKQYRENYTTHLTDVSSMKETTFGQLMKIRSHLSDLIQRGAELGGDALVIQRNVVSLYSSLLSDLHKCARNQNNDEALKRLDTAIEFDRGRIKLLCEHPAIAQFIRKDTPVTGDQFVPAILTEKPATIRMSMPMMDEKDPKIREEIALAGLNILVRAKLQGFVIEDYEEKIQALNITEYAKFAGDALLMNIIHVIKNDEPGKWLNLNTDSLCKGVSDSVRKYAKTAIPIYVVWLLRGKMRNDIGSTFTESAMAQFIMRFMKLDELDGTKNAFESIQSLGYSFGKLSEICAKYGKDEALKEKINGVDVPHEFYFAMFFVLQENREESLDTVAEVAEILIKAKNASLDAIDGLLANCLLRPDLKRRWR